MQKEENVKRIYPEARTGVINWIEQNFHDIEGFVCIFNLKDGTTQLVYDTYTYLEAIGLAEIAKNTIHVMTRNGEFVPKERE
ncbi:hypothetical protein FB479_11657 [Brevibacillus sp. AG162]|uniref:hypothetical protein n=1 Tax=Brevibacillus sp. AG162 TaxID=2572910 RepID=UPI00114E4FDF|nr:hypothetical protein [Brevibacillus sp. AG162]TQK41956.1 hypothetical protein FB479_11657 [Brevibacillus sp. AG162]